MSVPILADANTDYGLGQTAIMISELQTAGDDTATFRIAFDVIATDGSSIVSGNSGGASTGQSWGVGSDAILSGSNAEAVQLGNLRIIKFNAKGGHLTIEDFRSPVSQSVTIVNAQSGI